MVERRNVLRLTGASITGGALYAAGNSVSGKHTSPGTLDPENIDVDDNGHEDVTVSNLLSAGQMIGIHVVDVDTTTPITETTVDVPANERANVEDVIPKDYDRNMAVVASIGGKGIAKDDANWVAADPGSRSLKFTLLPQERSAGGPPDVKSRREQLCFGGGS